MGRLDDLSHMSPPRWPDLRVRIPNPHSVSGYTVVKTKAVLADWMGGTGARPLPDFELDMPKDVEVVWAKGNQIRIQETGRPNRDVFFMSMAELAALRSTCKRGHTGAVLVRGKHPVAIGYNGAPAGMKHCTEVGCEPYVTGEGVTPGKGLEYDQTVQDALNQHGCQRTIHAEVNAITHAAKYGISTEGCTMYTLSQPCLRCAQAIISAGIEEVVWRKEYRAARLDLLDKALIKVRHA